MRNTVSHKRTVIFNNSEKSDPLAFVKYTQAEELKRVRKAIEEENKRVRKAQKISEKSVCLYTDNLDKPDTAWDIAKTVAMIAAFVSLFTYGAYISI